MKRDRTLGFQNSAGSRYVERILTIMATCRKQQANSLQYLTDVLVASLNGTPVPSPITR